MDRRTFLQSTAAASALTSQSIAASGQTNSGSAKNSISALTQNLNPTIRHARDVAINILKPSSKDLQHGLELHADSVVFDSYGFAPERPSMAMC